MQENLKKKFFLAKKLFCPEIHDVKLRQKKYFHASKTLNLQFSIALFFTCLLRY